MHAVNSQRAKLEVNQVGRQRHGGSIQVKLAQHSPTETPRTPAKVPPSAKRIAPQTVRERKRHEQPCQPSRAMRPGNLGPPPRFRVLFQFQEMTKLSLFRTTTDHVYIPASFQQPEKLADDKCLG